MTNIPGIIDNIQHTLKDDLISELKDGSKLSVAAACFSMYAYQELKSQLENIQELRFIFTSPAFLKEKEPKQRREFFIPRLNRERSLYGSEFEIKLRNEMSQKAVARECADWIRRKVTFKSNVSNEQMMGFVHVDNTSYAPVNGFTTVELGCERGNVAYTMINKLHAPYSQHYLRNFDSLWRDERRLQDVTDEVLDSITAAYQENAPELIYFITLYNIFSEFLEDLSEDVLPNEATGFKQSKIWSTLFNFQQDAALAIINKLEKYNGCILADSVGLGKTYTALAVIKYYENRNKSVLVLCPKKLSDNWRTFKGNYLNNPLVEDRLRYDVLYHTDLGRVRGHSGEIDLSRINWGNYDLVVIDESHNFRNGGQTYGDDLRQNRYLTLLNKVIRQGVKTKVLMLSATPVNNRFLDLRNQLALAYEGHSEWIDERLNTEKPIDEIFRTAQRAFNTWSKLPAEERTTARMLKMLDFDFFEVLDSVTIARSRKHIEKYYDTSAIGRFPTRLKPISLFPDLTDLPKAITYNEIFGELQQLNLRIYTPTYYIHASKLAKYNQQDQDDKIVGLNQSGREEGIRRLMAVNLMKRMESSVHSFLLTVQRILTTIQSTINTIDQFTAAQAKPLELDWADISLDLDEDDQNADLFTVGRKTKIDLADMDYLSWRQALAADEKILQLLVYMVQDITPQHDSKLQELKVLIDNKLQNPINPGNQKILIFSAFMDTVQYLYQHVSTYVLQEYGLHTAMISGTVDGRSTLRLKRTDLNTVLTLFSPISKYRDLLNESIPGEIDILIATDCVSEGQNLQDCDYLINYDIHWNPVRIIQRFGRIDRIGSRNAQIQLVNFWPNVTLDEYINLKARVETRMKIVDMTATGDDNPISDEDRVELEYRKKQLKRLQDEVVDVEDMSGGISIMDLGLNEFRMDLLEYIKEHPDMDGVPYGLHAVTLAKQDCPPGVIYVLKNRENSVNIDKQNRLHPFYMVYIREDGSILTDHLSPKELLDKLRFLCRGKDEPDGALCTQFKKETRDGRNMRRYSDLLGEAIQSIIEVKEESDIDSLFTRGGTTALQTKITGLDDFELICFVVVKE